VYKILTFLCVLCYTITVGLAEHRSVLHSHAYAGMRMAKTGSVAVSLGRAHILCLAGTLSAPSDLHTALQILFKTTPF